LTHAIYGAKKAIDVPGKSYLHFIGICDIYVNDNQHTDVYGWQYSVVFDGNVRDTRRFIRDILQ
jgi:hypothetical protein